MGVLEDLPNDVLRHIISFIPTQAMAVKTRLVSTRWPALWNKTTVQHKHGSVSVTVTRILGPFGAHGASHCDWIKQFHPPWRLEFYYVESGRFLVASLGSTKGKLHLDFSNGKFPDNDDNISVLWTCLRLMGLCYLDLPYIGTEPNIGAPKAPLEEDRISSLPDKVLEQIICLLPIKSMAQAGTVSIRWHDLQFKGVSKYVFNPPSRGLTTGSPTYDYNSSLRLVTTGSSSIDHDFDYVLSTFLEFMVSYIPPHPPISSILLTSVNRPSQEEFVIHLLSNSRFHDLKSLEIINSHGLSNFNLCGLKDLRRLSIKDCGEEPLNIFRYHNVGTSFDCGENCEFTHVSIFHGISNVMLDFTKGPMAKDVPLKYQLLFILRPLQRARIVTMCRWMFEGMMRKSPYARSVEFHNVRMLKWLDSFMEEENINCLITSLKYFPMLQRLYVTVDPTCYRLPSNEVDIGTSGECTNGYFMSSSTNQQLLPHLQWLKMSSFEHEEDESRLARRIFYLCGSRPAKRTVRVLATSQRFNQGRLVVEISSNLCRYIVCSQS